MKPPEIAGLVRDSADTVKDEISALLSPQVHEKELDHEMKQLRLDLIDRQIRMNLPKRHCDQLAVAELAFAKTYPALRFVAWGKIAKSGCGLPGLSDLDEPVDTSKIPGYQLSTTAS